jgi:hypothetical protein
MDKVDLADLQILTTQALIQVGGGCASCDQQMNPPSSLDATRAPQVMNLNIDYNDERILPM